MNIVILWYNDMFYWWEMQYQTKNQISKIKNTE
jgi:hypothetical protein